MSQRVPQASASVAGFFGPRFMPWMLVLGLLGSIGGCSNKTYLIATPTVMVGEVGREVYDTLDPTRQVPEIPVLYAGDREIVRQTPLLGIEYGAGRSGRLVIGRATIAFDPAPDWQGLADLSTSERFPRGKRPSLRIKNAEEVGVLAVPLVEMSVIDGQYALRADQRAALNESIRRFHVLLRDELARTDRKDVFVFVHGFNNTFQDAIFTLGMMWHAAGRPGVAVAYTWPAGMGGLFGYAYDRESGEYTTFHLKRFLKALASSPDVERVHLIAHSRGTDVVSTALRELHIEYRAKNLRTAEQLKLQNLVLAAPDLDAQVFRQRFAIEDLHLAARRVTIYLSREDFALWASNLLFGGKARMGNLTIDELGPEAVRQMQALREFHIIDCRVTGFGSSHNYAFTHPAVLSDLILLLRDGRAPGAENGRPLEEPYHRVWVITNDYLKHVPAPAPGPPPQSDPPPVPTTMPEPE